MIFKPYYYFETGCAAYLVGCGGLGRCAVALADVPDKPAEMAEILRKNRGEPDYHHHGRDDDDAARAP